MKEVHKINVTELDAMSIKGIIKLLDLYVEGYKVNQQLNHLYFDDPILLFASHVKKQLRNVKFKQGYIRGEKFMKQFIADAVKERSLIKGNGSYANF